MIGVPEIIIILIVAGVLLFGGKKVTEFARSLGKFSSEFKKGKMEAEKELKDIQDVTKDATGESKQAP
ncbi:MAG: twin-arginine translocase TatA/TatE family subunit, partial [Patescibacteria group bacterium]